MKKILKINGLIFLILMTWSWVYQGQPLFPLFSLVLMIIAPIMLFSYNWGMETYIVSLILLLTILIMIYGYKNIDLKRGIVSFLIGFWTYWLSSLMFVGSHF